MLLFFRAKRSLRAVCLVVAVALALLPIAGCSTKEKVDTEYIEEVLTERLSALWATVSEDTALTIPEEGTTVFLSLCDRENRAKVAHATSTSLESAWKDAESRARKLAKEQGIVPLWVKADVVTASGPFSAKEVAEELARVSDKSFRYGLALDSEMETAFLEQECNANDIYNYKDDKISAEKIGEYLGGENVVLSDVVLFVTQGYFCGTDVVVRKLSADEDDFGVRQIAMNQDTAKALCSLGASYLSWQMQPDGSFRYGYYAGSGDDLGGYNSLRHMGTIWSLVEAYRLDSSDELATVIDKAINYAIENYIVYRDDDTAFVKETGLDALNIGGGGLAAVALSTYKEVFQTDRYDKLLDALGNGILAMSDPETGKYWHRWSPDFIKADEFISVYYEGEATFGLLKLYGQNPRAEYLNMAKKAVDRFILEDYTKYRDHWVAYALNEITKYVPEERYYTFALQNIQNNMGHIRNKDASYHTVTELLMAGYDTYSRIIKSGAKVGYLEKFDEEALLNAVDDRAKLGCAAFGFPEVVMYFDKPMEMYGCFFARRDNFRARIDDIQHFIGGYAQYTKHDLSLVGSTKK